MEAYKSENKIKKKGKQLTLNSFKYILLLLLVIFGVNCTSSSGAPTPTNNSSAVNKKVIASYKQAIPNDNFYFISGLDRNYKLDTNVKYRGILYSDKLREARSMKGIPIILNSADEWLSPATIRDKYANAMEEPKEAAAMRAEVKKRFGEEAMISMDAGLRTYIDIFVDDILKLNTQKQIREYKEKVFDLQRTMNKKYNMYCPVISLQIRDRKHLNYEEVKMRINKLFINEPKVQQLLNKYKTTDQLSAGEMGYLMDYMPEPFWADGDKKQVPEIRFDMGAKDDKKSQDIWVKYIMYRHNLEVKVNE